MKYLILTVLLTISFVTNAQSESNLNSNQKVVLNQIYAEIDAQYPKKVVTKEDIEFEKEFEKSSKELEMIIGSIKVFGEKIEAPIKEFLKTDLAKYVGVIVVFKFFGESILFVFGIISLSITLLLSLRNMKKMAYINYGKVHKFTDNSIRHGDYEYEKVMYSEGAAFPLMYKISVFLIIAGTLAILI